MTGPGPDWVEQARRFVVTSGLADALAGATDPDGGSSRPDGGARGAVAADHAAECRWCPVCAGLAALRGHRPDLVEGLADVLSAAAAALRTHAAAGTAHPDAGSPAEEDPAPPAGPDAGESPPAAPVQRIDVA